MATYFNPRSHEESDALRDYAYKVLKNISIHALTKRATVEYTDNNNELSDFNPRSHEESDACRQS